MPFTFSRRQLDEPLFIRQEDLVSQQSVPFGQDTQRSPFTAYSAFSERQRQIPQDIQQRLDSLAETTPLFTEAALNIAPVGLARQTTQQAPRIFKGFKDLTTKFLDYAKGKTALSKQEIMDFARRPELKKGEADLLNRLGQEVKEAKVPAQEFADSIRRDLLELKPVKVKEPQYYGTTLNRPDFPATTQFPKALKGTKYEEVVFESPITTNGSSHYPNSKNYFAHARGDEVVEGGKKIWREQEIQSDLMAKKGLDRMVDDTIPFRQRNSNYQLLTDEGKAELRAEVDRLRPFENDRFGERIMRERIREKASKGYEKYRLPTGETIGKIEGFRPDTWTQRDPINKGAFSKTIQPNELKIGMEVRQGAFDEWIITDILGDGRFKAVPKEFYSHITEHSQGKIDAMKETFDLTGKSNPQYRRYENWGKFLKNKYGGKEVIDSQGNKWMEIDLKKEFGKLPIEAFGVLPFLPRRKEENKRELFPEPLFINIR